MAEPNAAALEFLTTRRSRPAKMLTDPVPDRAALVPLLTAAMRVPDHGKLEPWRFVVLERPALDRLAEGVPRRGAELGESARDIDKMRAQFADAGLVVAVVSSPDAEAPIPEVEQLLSAAAVCLSLLNAALAAGWGANWLTGWAVHDRAFAEAAFGLGPAERVAGLIHIGTERATPPDRPRPDVAAHTTWIER